MRLTTRRPNAPLDGLQRSGYRLVFTDKPSDLWKAVESMEPKKDNLIYSLGVIVDKDGVLTTVQWGSVAFKSGLSPGDKLIAVNGVAFDADRLRDAMRRAQGKGAPIDLLVRRDDRFSTVSVDYHDGLRYPRLERDASVPARLDDILAARQ